MTENMPIRRESRMSDGYPIASFSWPTLEPPRGKVVILHGVQSHARWYDNLGRVLSREGFETHFPDRRGSGANERDRGDAPSARRLIEDVVEILRDVRSAGPSVPTTLAGISWGGKIAVVATARHPELVDRLALICPGLHPRVGVDRRERLRIALAYFLKPLKRFPVPLSDPALFTSSPQGQAFIAADPLSIRLATARLLAASRFLDRFVSRARSKVARPTLLMLAGNDRIVDNARTKTYFDGIPDPRRRLIEYPEGCHTLEFDPEPDRYALDLAEWLRGEV